MRQFTNYIFFSFWKCAQGEEIGMTNVFISWLVVNDDF